LKNISPIRLLTIGSVIIAAFSFAVYLTATWVTSISSIVLALVLSFLIGAVTYILFYYIFKNYVTERLRILYRSIRKGKFSQPQNKFSLTEDVISNAEFETKKWTDERIEEILKLKEQEEFRREFLGNLAHELKTPVFTIQGYILTLLEGGLEDKKVNRTFLERAEKATERMTLILEDLDQMIKMEVNEIKLDLEIFDIVELVQNVFEDVELLTKEKNVTLQLSKEYNPIHVRADKHKINQVLTNLINNSILYGKKGGKTLVRFYVLDDIVTIEVSDDGLGIEDIHIPRLFERFYRVEKSRNRNKGGSGIGLAIVKHILEAHGQTISVRSTPNLGSTFTFGLDKGKS
jgi:two-component system, OmpR family, phosphate regulon sensor histidine kinase PhoR